MDGRPITNKECFYLMMLISFSPFLARIDLYYEMFSIKDRHNTFLTGAACPTVCLAGLPAD